LAEISVDIGEQTDLYVGYRYFNLSSLDIAPFNTPAYGNTEIDYEAHSAMLGLRYYFSAAAAPVVVDDTPPPAGCAQQTFLVFFDFNKANLTADAAGVVAEAAAAYKAGCSVVLVVGHTDTVGSMSYNQDLSERRAASVKAEMVNQGVPADAISTEGKSFSDPLVPTGPGVKEAQNRRAVISVQ
jgi:outer membrane protein OmpA-like peptidoglycan-associated protein